MLVFALATAPSPEVAKVGGPWVKMPVRFGGTRTVMAKAPDWPPSHRRPTYVADDQTIGFETIAAFDTANVVRRNRGRAQPYCTGRRAGLGP